MSEARYDENLDRWELEFKMFFSTQVMDRMKAISGIDGTSGFIAVACEECLEQFAVALAKTGVDKNLIADEVCSRGAGKVPIGIALGLFEPEKS